MTREQAVAIADAAREEKEVPPAAALGAVEQCFIELGDPDPEKPSPVRDVRVWLVRYDFEGGRWVELAVDDKSGQIVRVLRSR
jgi:hypothetical protein